MIHELKTWAVYFREMEHGRKTFEYRKDDRNYQVGDTLVLHETSDDLYTGRKLVREVIYIARGGFIPEGYCIMSIIDPWTGR
jgi:hypothetical protein